MDPAEQDRVDQLGARRKLIDVAERLFAERGIEAVSMRTITLEAGQRNNSAVAYHFGSRDGLIGAIIAERSGAADARRSELVAALRASDEPPAAADLLRAFVQPLAEQAARGRHYLRFLAQATGTSGMLDSVQPDALAWTNREILRRLAGNDPDAVGRRARWLTVATLRILADHEGALAAGAMRPMSVEDVVDDLVAMFTPLLSSR